MEDREWQIFPFSWECGFFAGVTSAIQWKDLFDHSMQDTVKEGETGVRFDKKFDFPPPVVQKFSQSSLDALDRKNN